MSDFSCASQTRVWQDHSLNATDTLDFSSSTLLFMVLLLQTAFPPGPAPRPPLPRSVLFPTKRKSSSLLPNAITFSEDQPLLLYLVPSSSYHSDLYPSLIYPTRWGGPWTDFPMSLELCMQWVLKKYVWISGLRGRVDFQLLCSGRVARVVYSQRPF